MAEADRQTDSGEGFQTSHQGKGFAGVRGTTRWCGRGPTTRRLVLPHKYCLYVSTTALWLYTSVPASSIIII